MSNTCQLRVLSTGKYCCAVQQLQVYENCLGSVKFANLPETTIEYEIVDDEWVPAEVASISGTGSVELYKPGTYRFGIDCDAIDGTVAPEDGAMSMCYECCPIEDYAQLLFLCMLDLKALLVASDNTTSTMVIIEQLEQICTKLLDLIANIGDLSELCDKLESVLTNLQELCAKIEEGNDQQLECLEQIKLNQEIQIKQNEILIEKMCQILGDPDAPCPDCPEEPKTICDVKGFLTYAQQEYSITAVTLGTTDISSKFALPVNGNNAPDLTAFKNTLVECLEAEGYTVTEQQGRDGWTLAYNGESLDITTVGEGQATFEATNCEEIT